MKTTKAQHDLLYKDLLTNFFQQFLEAFFPQIAERLDFSNFGQDNFLSQEHFADIVDSKLHRIDILAKVPLRGKKGEDYVIVEAQRSKKREFLARIFRYFAQIHIKTGQMVLPIVLYTDDAKWELTEDCPLDCARGPIPNAA